MTRLLFIVLAWLAHTFGTEVPYDDAPDDPMLFCVEPAQRPGGLDCYLLNDVPDGSTVIWSGRESQIDNAVVPPHGYVPFRDVNGHHRCFIKVGDTSHIWCADGYRTES